MLELANVTKRFGGLTAVNSLSCKVHQGEIVGLIGPNGAGKTTAFDIVSGFLPSDEGEVFFEGQPISDLRPDQICHLGICRTFQVVKPFGKSSVLDNVLIGALVRLKSIPRARKLAKEKLEQVGMESLLNSVANELTIGNRKRLEVARALATQPQMLLLDEPMGGLNPVEVDELMKLLRKIVATGITVFLIEHNMKAIMNLSNRIVVLHHGRKIAEGTPQETATDPQVVQAYLGEEV
jgi:branched-chain amino acid transport system ATP-binding protein